MARQIVRKTPFPTGYSELARVEADFGDWDDYEVGEMPGSAVELEQDRREKSPLYRENLRFKNPNDLANQIDNDELNLRKQLRDRWLKIPQEHRLQTSRDWWDYQNPEVDAPDEEWLLSNEFVNDIVDNPTTVDTALLDEFLTKRGY